MADFQNTTAHQGPAAGFVETAEGGVTVTRADGTQVQLKTGDPVFEGDAVQTAPGGDVSITFVDQGTLALGENAEMTIDALVYDADDQSGEALLNIVQGVFVYASGMIAKTDPDAMAIATPVSTLGIRGTKLVGRADPDGGENTVTLLEEDNGYVGEIVVTTDSGAQVLNQVNQTASVSNTGFQTTSPTTLDMGAITNLYGQRRDLVPAHKLDRRDDTQIQDAAPSNEAAPMALEAEEAAAKSAPADLQMLDEAIFELPAEATIDDTLRTPDQFADPVPLAANHHDDSDMPWTDEMLAAWYEHQLADMSAGELPTQVPHGQMPHDMMTALLAQPHEIDIKDRFYPADDTIRHDLGGATFIDAPTDIVTEPAEVLPQPTTQNLDAGVTLLSNILAEQPLNPANDDGGNEFSTSTNEVLNTNSDAESYTSAAPASNSAEPVLQLA